MLEFTAKTSDLKKALSVVSLALMESAEDVHSHALFSYSEKQALVTLHSTDKDKMAVSRFPVKDAAGSKTVEFTADPKRLLTLIGNTDLNDIKFTYDDATKTLDVFASEDSESHVAFASFDPNEFLSFDKELGAAFEMKTFDTSMFLTAIRFIQGFLPGDDKEKKFSNLFFDKGTIYGTNGSNRIGAFKSDDFAGISDMTIRRAMIAPIISMLDRVDSYLVKMKASDKVIVVSTADDLHSFGFRRSVIPMPKMPIQTEVPKLDGFNVDRTAFIKKLNRLSVVSREDVGLKMTLKAGDKADLVIETITDRKSHEKLACQRISGSSDLDFILECSRVKAILGLFQASNVDMYVDKTKSYLYSAADLEIEENDTKTKKPFISVGLMALSKKI